jgi:hypothetical protein
MGKFSDYKAIGCIGTCNNTTPEPVVDGTFRKVAAFDTITIARNCSASTDDNEFTGLPVGDYAIDMTVRADGSNKIFVFAVFVNDTETLLAPSDKGEGHITMTAGMWLPANAKIDLRQKSTDGGTALTIHSMSLRLIRQTDAQVPSV